MDKPYDSLFSLIITRNPKAILDLLYPGSEFVKFHDTKLSGTQRLPDKIIEAKWRNTGVHFLAQPDCQSRPDPEIALRQLLYHVAILLQPWQPKDIEQKMKVCSKTLNLTEEAKGVQDLLHVTAPGPDGQEMHAIDFSCESRVMSDWTPEELIDLRHVELLALLPCTRGGAAPAWVEYMIVHLQGPENADLLFGGLNVAERMFAFHNQKDDLKWFKKRRADMINDPFITGTEFCQEILARGRATAEAEIEAAKAAATAATQQAQAATQQAQAATQQAQAEAQARAKAEAQAQIQQLAAQAAKAEAEAAQAKAEAAQARVLQTVLQAQQNIVQIITKRFLALAAMASDLLIKISKPDILLDLLTKLALAENAEEAEQCLRRTQAALA